MNNFLIDLFFTFFTLYAFIRIIAYGLYEIKDNQNKFGGIFVIAFSFVCFIFGNIMLWIH